MGADEVRAFLGYLASELQVAASTHQQALSALLFLYREVLGVDLPWLTDLDRPQKPKRTPVVLSRGEVERLLAVMEGTHALMARLLYGTGMRLMECVRLRVKDVDFERGELTVRHGKGGKDRLTVLPASAVPALQAHLARVRVLWERDEEAGRPGVQMPEALARKYPSAPKAWGWFWVFRRASCQLIHEAALSAATTRMSRPCSGRSRQQSGWRESPSRRRRIRCVTRSPRICWNPATTFAPCRSCWGIRMFRRR